MRLITAVLSLFLLGSISHAKQVLMEISWDKTKPTAGEVIPAAGQTPFAQVKITNTGAKPLTVILVTMDDPGITAPEYSVTGQVRYEDVEGKAYLEMWSVFPDGSRYFTRTLGAGSMSPMEGSSEWRELMLPFNVMDGKERPTKLIINVVFPGEGTVYIGPLRLVQTASTQPAGEWWTPMAAARWGGIIGGGFGAGIGILGGLIGWLAPRGKARGLVMTIWMVFLAVSIATLVAGIAALGDRQPYWVYYPLLLTGLIGTAVMGPLTLVIRNAYNQAELRKMDSQDAR